MFTIVKINLLNVKLGQSRIFSFGVGSSPNRYLLERMVGRGPWPTWAS